MKRSLFASLIIICFLIPFLTLLISVGTATHIDWREFFWAIKNTFAQASISSLLILLFGIWGAFGLFYLENNLTAKKYTIIESLILIPNILPSLFIILSCLYIINPFPFGRPGIIIIHLLINVGLASISIKNIIENKVGKMAELANIEGASTFQFLWTGILTYLKKEFLIIFLFFFSLCFVSFQIPLVVGGGHGTTIEVLISEKILIENSLPQAISLAIIQCFALFTLATGTYIFSHSSNIENINPKNKELIASKLLQYKSGILPLIISTFILLSAPLIAIPDGIRQLQNINFQWLSLFTLMSSSFILAFLTGFIVILLSLFVCYYYDQKYLHGFLYSFISPSPVIMGLCLYIWKWLNFIPNHIILSIGLCFLWFSGLFRLFIVNQLQSLKKQIWVAQSLGASSQMIFLNILIPQISPSIAKAAGLASLWAIGDFALSQFLSGEDFHLAMVIKTLGSHYRLSSALTLSWFLIAVGGLVYLFFIGVGRVFSKKSFL